MKKTLIALTIIVLLVGITALMLNSDEKSETITGNTINEQNSEIIQMANSIDKQKSSFGFIGYAFGGLKSHEGKFNEWEGTLDMDNGQVKSMEGTVKTASIDTGIEKLDNHLISSDFFDVEKYPEIKFLSTNFNAETNQMTGDLTFHGVTDTVTFPIQATDNSVTAEFNFNTEPFNFKSAMVKKEVKIKFSFVV